MGGRRAGEKSPANIGKQLANVNDLKGQQAQASKKAQGAPAKLKKAAPSRAKGDDC